MATRAVIPLPPVVPLAATVSLLPALLKTLTALPAKRIHSRRLIAGLGFARLQLRTPQQIRQVLVPLVPPRLRRTLLNVNKALAAVPSLP